MRLTMSPDTIGPYRVTRVLGQGGMGVVYAAHDDRLDRPVAIKVVRPDALADSAALTRFRREARAAARTSTQSSVRRRTRWSVSCSAERDGRPTPASWPAW
jgi:serine/threonine protein kinase